MYSKSKRKEKEKKRNINNNLAILPSHNINASISCLLVIPFVKHALKAAICSGLGLGEIALCYDLAKWLSHYLYFFSFLFFFRTYYTRERVRNMTKVTGHIM